jgi:hypothetical protein
MVFAKFIVLTADGALIGSVEDGNSAAVLADAAALDGNVNTYVVSAVGGIHTPRGFPANPTAGEAAIETKVRDEAKKLVADVKAATQKALADAIKAAQPSTSRADREAELKALTADEVRAIAAGLGVEHPTKAENVAAILAVEFPA